MPFQSVDRMVTPGTSKTTGSLIFSVTMRVLLLCDRRFRRGPQCAVADHQEQGANCACRTLSRIVVRLRGAGD